jgi:hypothetical protein
MPARIVYVDHASDTGGAEKSLLDLIARLDRTRFEPTLLCSQDAEWLPPEPLAGLVVERAFAPGGVLDRQRDQLSGGLLGSKRDLAAAAKPVLDLWRRFRGLPRTRPVGGSYGICAISSPKGMPCAGCFAQRGSFGPGSSPSPRR